MLERDIFLQQNKIEVYKEPEKKEFKVNIKVKRRYSKLIQNGSIQKIQRAISKKIITPKFKGLGNHSALYMAFFAKQYKLFVLLKSRGFTEFWYEPPLDITTLPETDQLSIKIAMRWLIQHGCGRKLVRN